MTFQDTRASLIVAGRIFEVARAAILTLALAFALFVIVTNFGDVREMTGRVVARLAQVEVSATSFKLGLSPESIAKVAQDSKEIPDNMKGLLLSNDLLALKERWVVRLLYVEAPGIKCDYATPTDRMAADLNADRHLAADGLITMDDDPALKAQVLKAMRDAKASRQPWTIGEPRACYRAALTWRGNNVKTALAEFIGSAFAAASESPEARAARAKVRLAALGSR